MRSNTKTRSTRSGRLTALSAASAAVAAMALTACGPHDTPDATTLVGGAPATTVAEPTPAATQGAPTTVPAVPVPLATPTAPFAAAPTYPATGYALPARAQAQNGYGQPVPMEAPVPERRAVVDRNTIGSVESIEPIRDRPQGSGAGAVIGGVLGAVVGNQFGHSAGRAAMTGLGAVGGAVAGNNIERNHREGITGYRVSIRLDNGSTRSYERADVVNLQVGDRVHLDASSFHRV